VNSSKKHTHFFKSLIGALCISFIIVTVGAFCLMRYIQKRNDKAIYHDIVQLQAAFSKIHKDCYISDFTHVKNYIDFLNVITFAGDHVGSMKVSFPRNWHGPYMKRQRLVSGVAYQVLKNKQGYFIVPGDGVQLANGKIIGKDLILDAQTDMQQLMNDGQGLKSEAGVLAAPILVGSKIVGDMATYPEIFSIID
jgi:hypothetical protein